MNRSYRTVWNAALGACVAAAENVSAPRAGGARGARRTAAARAVVALAAMAAGGAAQAVDIDVATEAELIAAIGTANASADPASRITYTAAFNITTVLPQLGANVTIDTAGKATTISAVGGASLDVRAGASYSSAAAIQIGTTATASGSLTAQGTGASVTGSVLSTGAGQATISVLGGANVTIAGNANLGGTNAASNGGITDVVVSGSGSRLNLATGYYHHDGSLTVSGGAIVESKVMQLGLSVGDVFSAVVTGPGTTVGTISGLLNIGANGTATVTVGDGATLKSNNGSSALLLASSANGTATLNIGAAAGDAPVAPGYVSATGITSGTNGRATINFNHDASNYEFALPISGTAKVNQVGSGTTILTGLNSYTGGTTIAAGTLQIGNGGATGLIGGNVVNDATLAVVRNNAFSLAANISGGGLLRQSGTGTTTLTGTNSYTGGTVVESGGLTAGSAGAFVQNSAYTVNGGTLNLGSWDLAASSFSGTGGTVALNAQTLTLNQAGDGGYAGAITGNGNLVKAGGGVFMLSGKNSHTGATDVAAGTLRAGAANSFSAGSAVTVQAGATLDLAGFSQRIAGMALSGMASTVGSTAGTTLTVTGPWVGNGGTLRLGTVLGDSTSLSDRLVFDGATAAASGTTRLAISNLGGLGALTTGNGIEVVSAINGATTTAQGTKDAFVLNGGHVDAGAYEYRLYAADATGAGENWYLRSTAIAAPATPAAPALEVPVYRAEVPLVAAAPAQFRRASLSMLANLNQRVGDAQGDPGQRRAWGRVISTDIDLRQGGTVSPGSSGHVSGFQAGTDLWAHQNWRLGVYAGQLEGDVDVSGFARGVANLKVGQNDLRSQFFGVYGTWTADSGLYVDTVLQGARHRYTAKAAFNAPVSSDGSGTLVSVEVGRPFQLAPGWTVEPQLQLAHQRQRFDDLLIPGAVVSTDADSGWTVRAGVRVKGEVQTAQGLLQPYARLNVYRTRSGADVARFASLSGYTDIRSATGGNTGTELALGASWRLTPAVGVYGELGRLWSSGGAASDKSGLGGSVGVRVLW